MFTNNKLFLLILLLSASLQASSYEEVGGAMRVKNVIASLKVLNDYAKRSDDLSIEEQNYIKSHVNNILLLAPIKAFNPLTYESVKTHESTCCTWHEYNWLDDNNWAEDVCCGLINKYSNSNDYCINSLLTFGALPALHGLAAGLAGASQGILKLLAFPTRCIGNCDEYDHKPSVNKPMLSSFVQQGAILIKTNYFSEELSQDEQQILNNLAKAVDEKCL